MGLPDARSTDSSIRGQAGLPDANRIAKQRLPKRKTMPELHLRDLLDYPNKIRTNILAKTKPRGILPSIPLRGPPCHSPHPLTPSPHPTSSPNSTPPAPKHSKSSPRSSTSPPPRGQTPPIAPTSANPASPQPKSSPSLSPVLDPVPPTAAWGVSGRCKRHTIPRHTTASRGPSGQRLTHTTPPIPTPSPNKPKKPSSR